MLQFYFICFLCRIRNFALQNFEVCISRNTFLQLKKKIFTAKFYAREFEN